MNYSSSRFGQRARKKKIIKRWLVFLFTLLVFSGVGVYMTYTIVLKPNVWISSTDNGEAEIFVPKGSDFDQLKEILYEKGLIIHRKNFEFWADFQELPELVKSGHYTLKSGMNNRALVNMLRSGSQTPVNVVINKERLITGMAGRLGRQLEIDSAEILHKLTDSTYLASIGFTPENQMALFIPNTYEIYWTISVDHLFDRLKREYDTFWNISRMERAEQIQLTPNEVVALASIVEEETNMNLEKQRVAGVYINRLNRNWRLQADPTLKYAVGDFTIKRVLNDHKKVDSPYNTYLYLGLPPGPICSPSIASIDAVLNYEEHDYMFFCAKEDFSGYHNFAKTAAQHGANARKYQQALNRRKIYK